MATQLLLLPSVGATHLEHWQTPPVPVVPSTMHIKLDKRSGGTAT